MRNSLSALVSGAVFTLAVACSAPSDKMEPAAGMGTAAGTLAEPNIAEVRAAIEAANQKWQTAVLAGDATAAVGNYADDAVLMLPMSPALNGRPAIEAGMKEWLGMAKVNDAKMTTLDVTVSGDLAIETGTFAMTFTNKGEKPVTDNGKYLSVWKRQADGSWKIIRDINNSDGAPPAKSK